MAPYVFGNWKKSCLGQQLYVTCKV
uniref:Uncharacterized protein n=1 Tax=Arundo donax TaxID=35708 RepID=A0A0A9DPQ7_ARUDO